MGNIVFADLENIDLRTTSLKVVESTDHLTDETVLLSSSDTYPEAELNKGHNVFVPSDLLDNGSAAAGVYVFFDLEIYPFFQKVKENIQKQDKPKGVFRFRRIVGKDETTSLAVGDLFIIASLLGEPEAVKVKHTNHTVTPYHMIVTVNFGEGTMAHMEYTFGNDAERIELEWSGIKNIIEFNSQEMAPIDPSSNTNLPLAYSVDSILNTARNADSVLIKRLNKYCQLINGGAD
ncbi:hypothetical protein ACFO3D_07085 [Virgibacillus kekensis]|uniref:Uncharacterized protein n=1 Tax=Virgibacillus kekensis TaxID=202261 RepID=A0ABV9DIZ7_9BACI